MAQLVEHRTGIAKVMGLDPVWASDFFPVLSLQPLKLLSQLRRLLSLAQIAPCKRIHEGPEFRIPASRFRIPASGFWIPTLWIPNSNLLDSGFHTKAVDSGFQTIVDSGFQSLDSNSKNLLDSGFRILLHGATQITIISTFFTDNEERFIPSTRAFIFDALWPSISKWGLKVDRRYEATRPLTNTGPWFGAGDFRLLLSSRKGFSSENKSYEMPNGTIPTEFGLSDVEVLILQGNLTLKLQRLYITFFRKFPWIASFLAVFFFYNISSWTCFPRLQISSIERNALWLLKSYDSIMQVSCNKPSYFLNQFVCLWGLFRFMLHH